MAQNASLKVLMIAVLVVLVLVIFFSLGGKKVENQIVDANNVNAQSGDNINESLHTVSAKYQKLINQIASIDKQFKATNEQNKVLKGEIEALKNQVKEPHSDRNAAVQGLQDKVQQLDGRVSDLASQRTAKEEQSYQINETQKTVVASNEEPLGVIGDIRLKHVITDEEKKTWHLPKSKEKVRLLKKQLSNRRYLSSSQKDKEKALPYYTIPAGSDFGNATLLQALIGEVPAENKLQQPLFPFSAIVSRGSLMSANGVPLPPDIMGMKVSGYAIGVGSFLDGISCVRAYLTSALFVFQDGHFVTVGEEKMNTSANLMGSEGDNTVGYLTTQFGNPCMPGKYYTNAPRVLAAMVATGGIEGLGEGISDWQMSYLAGANGTTAVPTGSFGKFVLGKVGANGASKASDWLEKRISGSFDMVFIPASVPVMRGKQKQFVPTKVAIHITKTIDIDKKINGRRINYGRPQTYFNDHSLK